MIENKKYLKWKMALLSADSTIEEVIQNLNDTALQIVLITNKKKKINRNDNGW